MRKNKARGLFEDQFRQGKITNMKDPLEQLNKFIKWEDFRPLLDKAFAVTDPSVGGRPAFDRVMMFKVLVLQRMYNLSDDNTKYQILDRHSFCKFLGIDSYAQVPDSKTIWHYREQLKKHEVIYEIFSLFNEKLQSAALILKDGVIVDASIIQVQDSAIPERKTSRSAKVLFLMTGKINPISLNKRIWMPIGLRKTGKRFSAIKTTSRLTKAVN